MVQVLSSRTEAVSILLRLESQSGQSSISQTRQDNDEPRDEDVPLRLDAQQDEKALDAPEHKGSQECADE